MTESPQLRLYHKEMNKYTALKCDQKDRNLFCSAGKGRPKNLTIRLMDCQQKCKLDTVRKSTDLGLI